MAFGRWKRMSHRTGGEVRYGAPPIPAGAGRVDCQVLDPVGLPMAADVALIDVEGQQIVHGSSDPYGLFLATVPPGAYQLSVTADGYQPHRRNVQVTAQACASAGEIRLDTAPQPPLPAPGRWDIDPTHSAVRFIARHIGLAEIHGRFNDFYGSVWISDRVPDSQLEVYIGAASIDTGVTMRDDHLRSADFLDVDTYPYLQFTGGRFTHRGGSHWAVPGVLHLHGVDRTVRLDVTYLGLGTGMDGETRAACKVTTELHREDFTLNWQRMLARGIAVVGATIRVEIDIQVIKADRDADPGS
jgi:polyisoprenoid-binding protein YceI